MIFSGREVKNIYPNEVEYAMFSFPVYGTKINEVIMGIRRGGKFMIQYNDKYGWVPILLIDNGESLSVGETDFPF